MCLHTLGLQYCCEIAHVICLLAAADERSPMDAELASLRAELADSQKQLSAARTNSTSNASALHAAQQEIESWKTQHGALQDSSGSELAALRQQLADSESYSDDLAKLKEQLNQAEASSAELEALRLQLREFESASAELDTLRQQLKTSESSSAELETLQQQLKEAESFSDELEALRRQLKDSESAASELEGLKVQLEETESASKDLHSVKQQLTEAEALNAKNSESLKEAEQRVTELQAELEELRVSSAAAADTASQVTKLSQVCRAFKQRCFDGQSFLDQSLCNVLYFSAWCLTTWHASVALALDMTHIMSLREAQIIVQNSL